MRFGQWLRRYDRHLKAALAGLNARFACWRTRAPDEPHERIRRRPPGAVWPWRKRAAVALVVFLILLYPGWAFFASYVDDDPAFAAPADTTGGKRSEAVANMIALIDREVNRHDWVPNDPWFMPTALLDNMRNFQRGIMGALGRFAFELTDQLGRTRGSSQADEDLQAAAGLLQYAPDVWVWDPSVSLLPTATSEQQYRKAIAALSRYNARLAAGKAVFDRRSDNLLATLDRIAADLSSTSALIDRHINDHAGFIVSTRTDDVFYDVKGRIDAYDIVLKGLRHDFTALIAQRDVGASWDAMLASLDEALAMRPLVVLNGAPASEFIPCHLCGEGFYLLRARTQLREITDILSK